MPASPIARRNHLLRLLAEASHCERELARRLHVSRRTVHNDLRDLDQRFPRRIQRRRDAANNVILGWDGPIPHLLRDTIDHLDHLELIALVAARGPMELH